jgi:glycerophosphoryl diester phosphodiesterase
VTYRHVENTRGSVRAAINRGLRFEVDLRTTVDGHIVLMHDPTVRRTTDGRGRVADMTAARVRSLTTNDGSNVPYALAVLRMVRDHPGASALLDLKALPRAAQESLAHAITSYGIGGRVQAISFSKALLTTFRSLNPGVGARRTYGSSLPTPAEAAGGVTVRVSSVTTEWATSMRQAAVPFGVWDADDAQAWARANDAGADTVITNDPAGYATWCAASV